MNRLLIRGLSCLLIFSFLADPTAVSGFTGPHSYATTTNQAVFTSQALSSTAFFIRPSRLLRHLPFAEVFRFFRHGSRHGGSWMGAFSVWTGFFLTALTLGPILYNAGLLELIVKDIALAHRFVRPMFESSALGLTAVLLVVSARIGFMTFAGIIARAQKAPTPEQKKQFEERYEVQLLSSEDRWGGTITGYFSKDPRLYLHEGFAVPWGRLEAVRAIALPALLGHAEMRWGGMERMTFWPLYLYARVLQQIMAWLALLLPANNSVRGRTLGTLNGDRSLAALKRQAYDRLARRMKVRVEDRAEWVERTALGTMPFKRTRTFYSQWRMLLWQQLWILSASSVALRILHRPYLYGDIVLLYVAMSGVLALLYAYFDFSRAVGDTNLQEYTVRLRPWILDFEVLVRQALSHEGIHILKEQGYLKTDIVTSAVDVLTAYETLKERDFFQTQKYTNLWLPDSDVSRASMFYELVDFDILEGYKTASDALSAVALHDAENEQVTRQALLDLTRKKPTDIIGRGGENYSLSQRLGGVAIALYDATPVSNDDDAGGIPWFFIRELARGGSILDAFDGSMIRIYQPSFTGSDPIAKLPEAPARHAFTVHFSMTQHGRLDAPLIAAIVLLLHPIAPWVALKLLSIFSVSLLGWTYIAHRWGKLAAQPGYFYDIALGCAVVLLLPHFYETDYSSQLIMSLIGFAFSRAIYTAYRSYYNSGYNRLHPLSKFIRVAA